MQYSTASYAPIRISPDSSAIAQQPENNKRPIIVDMALSEQDIYVMNYSKST